MIKIKLDVIMAKRGITLTELAGIVGMTTANLSRLKCGKCKGIHFDTLEHICRALKCDVADILEFVED